MLRASSGGSARRCPVHSTTLSFMSMSGGVFGGILLDKIEINAVPEPASIGLIGLAATSFFVVRRRRLSV